MTFKLQRLSFNLEDASQVMIGAFTLAVPISFSEEAWQLGETLARGNLVMLMSMSLLFLGLYARQVVFQGDIKHRYWAFVARVIIAYGLTTFVVILTLIALDKFPIWSQPEIALKRLIVISMPASMGAIIVDSFDKE